MMELLTMTLLLLCPFAIGAIGFSAITVSGALVVLGGVAWLRRDSKLAAYRLAGLVASVCLTLTGFDLIARPLLREALLFRPTGMFESPLPQMPLISRYTANIHFKGQVYGDLVGLTGIRADREDREEKFITDSYGFRNDIPDSSRPRPLDAIILGDSMADGANTTQEDILSAVLSRDYGYRTYNLSVAGSGPWGEYVTLLLEISRLTIKQRGTILLWFIFTGNDLEDHCYPLFDKGQLPLNGWLRSQSVTYATFRSRSPTRLLRLYTGLFLRARLNVDRSPLYPILRKDFLDGRKLLFLQTHNQLKSRNSYQISGSPNFPCVKSTFDAMSKLVVQKGVKVAVILVPTKEEVYSWVVDDLAPWSTSLEPSGFSVVFNKLSEQEHFYFLDLKPFLVKASRQVWEQSRQLIWWHDDIHWNAAGQREAASIVNRLVLRPLATGQ